MSVQDVMAPILRRYEELGQLLASPEVAQDPAKIREYAQEQAALVDLVEAYGEQERLAKELADARALLEEESDPQLQEMFREEIARLEDRLAQAEARLKTLLLPRDPRDERNVIMEIRAGTGGDEAALFAADLFRMYAQYAQQKGWKIEVLSANQIGIGGYKEIIFAVKGKGAFSRLKYESGVHRVQRVPVTEASGRIHTSTATVAVLPEVDEVEVELNERDLRIDVYRSGGHGGQSVNTTDSAVRITHLPTGIVVQCQDERSQLQNKARAMSILRARLYELAHQQQFAELDAWRRKQVGSAERSEKIRTYNFPQNRVTDHRIGLSIYRLEDVLAGDIDPFIDELMAAEQAERLAKQAA
jgi:peptide chain release factor 1